MNHTSRNAHYVIALLLALVVAACGDNPVSTERAAASETHATLELPRPAAQAATSMPASGTVMQTEIISLDVRQAGPNTILKQTSRGVLEGTLAGSFEDDLKVTIHPNGTFTTRFTITCACTVDGQEGVVTITATDRGELVSPTLARFAGHATINRGTGALGGLRGVFEIEGTVDVPSGLSNYTYAGQIHYAPR